MTAEDNVVDLWSFAGDEPGERKGRKRGQGKPISHPQLGDLYCGASDSKGHRTTISMPQEMVDRMGAWQARLKGTPFDTHQGMLRHGAHIVLEMLDQCDDVVVDPELRRWIEVDKANAQQEQELRFVQETTKLVSLTVQTLEACVEQNDPIALARQLGRAENALDMLAPKPRKVMAGKIKEFEGELERMTKGE
jgi:hypothetical protein